MSEDTMTLMLCRSAAYTQPEGLAMIGAGLMTRPPDGVWMVAGLFDGMVPRSQIDVNIVVRVLDHSGTDVTPGATEEVELARPPSDQLAEGRMFLALGLPSLEELAAGAYTLRISLWDVQEDLKFVIGPSTLSEPSSADSSEPVGPSRPVAEPRVPPSRSRGHTRDHQAAVED